jgi:hypothetical protein
VVGQLQQEKDDPNTEVTETAEVVMPHLLLGMALANTQKQFLFVEEWRHVLTNQVLPMYSNFTHLTPTLWFFHTVITQCYW